MYAIIILTITIITTFAQKQSGGAPCKQASDCGGNTRGICYMNCYLLNATESGYCICFNEYGAPDCSYIKQSKYKLGALQIGLAFININGVGNKLAGYDARFLAQLLMGLSIWPVSIIACCLACCGLIKKKDSKTTPGIILGCIACIALILLLCAWGWGIADGAAMLNDPSWVDVNGYPLY